MYIYIYITNNYINTIDDVIKMKKNILLRKKKDKMLEITNNQNEMLIKFQKNNEYGGPLTAVPKLKE